MHNFDFYVIKLYIHINGAAIHTETYRFGEYKLKHISLHLTAFFKKNKTKTEKVEMKLFQIVNICFIFKLLNDDHT